MTLTVIPVLLNKGKRLTLDEKPFEDLEDWQKWEVINQQSIGVPSSWRGAMPEADSNGVFYLPMLRAVDGRWTYEYGKGQLTYSIKNGLERKLS